MNIDHEQMIIIKAKNFVNSCLLQLVKNKRATMRHIFF